MISAEPLARASAGPSTRGERRCAIALAIVLIVGAAAWSFSGPQAFPFSPAFIAAYDTALTMSAAFAALLLIFRARLIRDRSAALIAASFVFCVPLIVGYALTFPRVGALWLTHPEASGWMSFGWRIGWPVAVGWYAVRGSARRGSLRRAIGTALLISAAMIAVALSDRLPRLYAPGSNVYEPAVYIANDVMVGVAIVAVICLLRKPIVTLIDTWLAVALTVLASGSFLIVFTHARFSAAADAVRIINVVTSLILTGTLLYEFQRLMRLSTSLDRYLTMAQYAPSIVYLLDLQGACLYVNPRWVKLTGQAVHEALGAGWVAAIHPDDLVASKAAWETALAERREHEVELRYRTADGTYRWHLATATPTYDADGAMDGWFGTATDIDAQRLHADELKELYAREHSIAQTLQSAFVPPFLPDVDGLSFAAVYRPALREAELGGDWYDAFRLPDGRVAFSIGDVAGHGVDAAIAMVRLRETLRAATILNDVDPAHIIHVANQTFLTSHPDVIATALFGFYDATTRELTFARAGHPPPLLVRDGRATFIDSHPGIPIGIPQIDAAFTVSTLRLRAGDALALYTDGLTEMHRDLVGGEQRLISMLERFPDDVGRVVDETLDGTQRDDVALLKLAVVDVREVTTWHFESDDAGSAGDARFAFVAHLTRRRLDDEVIAKAEFVFGELVGNVVRHAPGPISIEVIASPHHLSIVVRDRGPHFMPKSYDLPDDTLAECGRGLFIIAHFSSPPVVLARPGGGNEVIVTLHHTATPPVTRSGEPDAAIAAG